MSSLLELHYVPGGLLQPVQTVHQTGQYLLVAGTDEKQSLLALKLAGRTGPVCEDHRIAEHIVSHLLQVQVEEQPEVLDKLLQLLHFARLRQGPAQRGVLKLCQKWRALQRCDMAA